MCIRLQCRAFWLKLVPILCEPLPVFKDQSSIEVGEDTLPMLPDGLGVT